MIVTFKFRQLGGFDKVVMQLFITWGFLTLSIPIKSPYEYDLIQVYGVYGMLRRRVTFLGNSN